MNISASKSLTFWYYNIKPLLPRKLQISIRSRIINKRRLFCHSIWPISESAADPSQKNIQWPDGKTFAFILTHDVDTAHGLKNCTKLLEIEQESGFRSSFNFVPERYGDTQQIRDYITEKGFEVGVHGLHHDGKLYSSREIFSQRAKKINAYLKQWNVVGFRSPAMHHNLDWLHDLNIEYDASTFDVDPFEPQSDGVNTIFPFWVSGNITQKGYVELPYTLVQDFTLFVLMGEKTDDIWKKKLDWIIEKRGMALVNTHPDYMNFSNKKLSYTEYQSKLYQDFLEYVQKNYKNYFWHALPKDVATLCRTLHKLRSNIQ